MQRAAGESGDGRTVRTDILGPFVGPTGGPLGQHAEGEVKIMKRFRCSDMGNSCDMVLTSSSEERIVEEVSMHLREKHGVLSITQDQVARIKNLLVNQATPDAASVVDRIFEKYNCKAEPECTWRYIAEAETILNGGQQAHERELRAA